jgi:hypothetical protein
MSDSEKNNGPWYVYCQTCKELIGKCNSVEIAFAIEHEHKESVGTKCCVITTGIKWYFDNAFPDIELEPSAVLITVSGGVAEVVDQPFGVKVEIRDYDVEEPDAENSDNCKQDDDGNWYQEIIWK